MNWTKETEKSRSQSRKLSFSKKLFIALIILTVLIIISGIVLAYITHDSTIFVYLIPSVFGELGVYSGFYLKKSEKENTKGGIVYENSLRENLVVEESEEEVLEEFPDEGM